MIRYRYDENSNKGFGVHTNEIKPELMKKIFNSMLRIRRIEEAIEEEYPKDQMKTPIHLVIGQEATAVGVCSALDKTDFVFCTHRTHGPYLAKGGNLEAFFGELYCKTSGCVGSRGGSMHLLDKETGMAGSSAIVGGSVPVGTGMALSAQMLKEDRVTVVFLGDAATEEGAVWESINFAYLKKLPVIYICENNFYSVCTPISTRQPEGVDIYKKAEGFGVQSAKVDGTNALEVYTAVKKAVERARAGGGPTFIESVAYRWRGHGGAGDDSASGYRDPEEVKLWQKHCPIETLYEYLLETGDIDDATREKMEAGIESEIKKALTHAINSPEPEEADLYTYLYSE